MARPTLPPRLLLIGLNYAPEPVGIGPYSAALAEGLAARGWDVRAIVGEPYYPHWVRAQDQGRFWRTTVERGVRVTRCPHFIPRRPTGAKRLIHHASFAASALVPAGIAALRHRPDFVLTVAPSLLSVPVGLLAARLARARSWVHVQDFEIEAAVATGLLPRNAGVTRIATQAERKVLGWADLVTTISPQMLDRLHSKGVADGSSRELRNWANHSAALEDASGDRYRDEWGIGQRRVALYSGNIANKQGLEIVIEAAALLAHRPDILLVICGNGPTRTRLAEQAAGLPNVRFEDLQPAERVGELLALADVHLLPQLAGAADLVLPSKLANMLASGRPIIATAEAGTGIAGEVADCGLVVSPGNAAALAAAIAELVDDPRRAGQLGRAGARRAGERWQADTIIDRLDAELRRDLAA